MRDATKRWIGLVVIFLAVIALDQGLKFWVKLNMMPGMANAIQIFGDRGMLYFTENPGMAFGMQFGDGSAGKLFLSLFRVFAVGFIGWYIYSLAQKGAKYGLLVCLTLIMAGAFGNIIDSAIYGMIFSESLPGRLAILFPEGGGYAPFLQGHVVDMFYFPFIQTTWPSWVPVKGGEPFIFFSPVFNLADSAITVGVFVVLIWQRTFFGPLERKAPGPSSSQEVRPKNPGSDDRGDDRGE